MSRFDASMIEVSRGNGRLRSFATTAPDLAQVSAQPATGEMTGNQGIAATASGLLGTVFGITAVGKATFRQYREMSGNPTVALAKIIASAPIRSAEWTFEEPGDNAQEPSERLQFVEETVGALLPIFLPEALRSFEYGAQNFEKVWEPRDGKLVITKLKPLLPDKTTILVTQDGRYDGLKQAKIVIPPENSLTVTYDGEAGNFYGRARHENIRKVWTAWEKTLAQTSAFFGRAATPIPMIEYPVGQSRDASGSLEDNFDIAKQIMANLSSGTGVLMPNVFMKWAEDLLRSGVDPSKLRAWQFAFIESKGSAGTQMVLSMRHLEVLMLRGWLIPERAAIEGQFGTKAEATQHSQVVAIAADMFLADLARNINWYLIDPLLILNFGEEARGTIQAMPSKVNDEMKQLLTSILEKVLTQPATFEQFIDVLNWDDAIDTVGLPRKADFEAQMVMPPELLSPNLPNQGQE